MHRDFLGRVRTNHITSYKLTLYELLVVFLRLHIVRRFVSLAVLAGKQDVVPLQTPQEGMVEKLSVVGK